MPHIFHSVALIGNTKDPQVAECMQTLAGHLSIRKVRVLVGPSVKLTLPANTELCDEESVASRAQLIIAIGGDGTLLYAASLVATYNVPLLGINRGRLGFLTDVSRKTMVEDVDSVLEGRFSEDRRSMLAATLQGSGAPRHSLALNDVVVNKRETGRILEFETSINGRFVNSHGGDGMIVATATGSTAYALSCGGPIVEPDLDVWVLAPICPHTLSDRPIIVRAGSKIKLQISDRFETLAQVTCDGNSIGALQQGDCLHIESANTQITLLHPPGYDYYRLLRSKLHWGRAGAGAQSE